MPNCSSCGIPIPDGQGSSCSMCYGDIGYGHDGYYEEWARQQESEEMTKQNDMPEDLREANRLGNREHFADSADGLKACIAYGALLDDYMRRADKPADNGGDELVWEDGKFPMDTTMLFSQSYNFDGLECFSQKTVTPIGRFMIWPDGRPDKKWNVYGERDGYFCSDLENEAAAKLEVEQTVSHAVAAPHPPEVSHVNDINVVDIPQAIENIGPNTTPEVSGEVDIATLKDEVINYINSVYMNPISVASGSAVETAISYLASRNLLKSEGVCVPDLDMDQLLYRSDKLGFWMSAALDDPKVCKEMKDDITSWFNALRPFLPAEKE